MVIAILINYNLFLLVCVCVKRISDQYTEIPCDKGQRLLQESQGFPWKSAHTVRHLLFSWSLFVSWVFLDVFKHLCFLWKWLHISFFKASIPKDVYLSICCLIDYADPQIGLFFFNFYDSLWARFTISVFFMIL